MNPINPDKPLPVANLQVKQAFIDGVNYATNCRTSDPEEAWRTSSAKARLDALEPTGNQGNTDLAAVAAAIGTDQVRSILAASGLEFEPAQDAFLEKIAALALAAIAIPPPPSTHMDALSDEQVEAVLHLIESRLCIVWAKIGAREEFANQLRVLETAPEEEREACEACGDAFEDGDLVYWLADDTGHIHADCCGPERESYVGEDGEPLKDGDPIPQPFAWRA